MIEEKLTEIMMDYPGGKKKKVRIFVPEHEEGETFPVIYMTDGQSIFDEESNSYGCWHTREAVKDERAVSGKSAVIVGIHNDDSPFERAQELTPKSIGKLFIPIKMEVVPEQQGEIFDEFVVDSVMPMVEEKFPVRKGRNNTAFCGSSSGGVQSLFTAVTHPDLFCAAGVFSPAIMIYTPEDVKNWISSAVRDEKMPFLYFFAGGADEQEKLISKSMETVYDIFMELYPQEKMTEVILPDKPHNESSWEPIFRDFLHTFLARSEEF